MAGGVQGRAQGTVSSSTQPTVPIPTSKIATAAPVTYDNKYELYGSINFMNFMAGQNLPKRMNLLSISEESAASRGVDVHRTQRLAFLSASLATGAAVSLGGPVGFIGIVIPHLVRLIVGADHRLVLPASAFGGAAFLVACDTISRTALSPLEVPVGVITAMIGGPFFLWLLIRKR